MRTAIAAHELLPDRPAPRKPEHRARVRWHPRGLQDEELPLPALRSRRSSGPQPLLPHRHGPALARELGPAGGPREALLLRRSLV
jgi:hypothetical protein